MIKHTRRGPTGYEVTFRYYAPQATRVQIKGEWYFERPSELPQLAGAPDYAAAENQAFTWREYPHERYP